MKKILILFYSFCPFISNSQNLLIERQTTTSSTTTNYTDGSSNTTSPSYTLKWRHVGETAWKNTGRRYKDIAPTLNKYESSAALLQKTKNLDLYGKGGGWLTMGAGVTMMFVGFGSSKEVETVDPISGEVTTETVKRTKLAYTGLGLIFAGYYVRWISIQISMKRFGQSCNAYNEMVNKDTGSIGRLDIGLSGSQLSSYPMMKVKLSF